MREGWLVLFFVNRFIGKPFHVVKACVGGEMGSIRRWKGGGVNHLTL